MRYPAVILLTSLVIIQAGEACCKSIEEYIGEAESKQHSGNISEAVRIMQEALREYPDNPALLGYLGGFTGMQAGTAFESGDMNMAGELTTKAFELLDRAVEIDGNNIIALLNRGMMGINVPEFFGRLRQGVDDLEKLMTLRKPDKDGKRDTMYLTELGLLATGYDKLGEQKKAYDLWKKIIDLAPGTPFAEQADQKLKNYMTSGDHQAKTRKTLAGDVPVVAELTEKLEKDPENPELLYELAMAYGNVADKGYDERIYEDTTFMTNIAFEVVNLLDKAVKLAPDNVKYRLASGISSVMMPFFVNRLERGMGDLIVVLESDAPDDLKAEARYWLGYAYYKKATTEWVKVISDYPKTEAAAMTFGRLLPPLKHFDRAMYSDPCVIIDFILGFRDELPPQTSVWIEDAQGNFVKTVYVSGFSGYAKEKQVNLPKWSKSSEYADVDGVTAASIDLGHHLYVWDLNDSKGNRVKPATYTVKVETS